jgi:hypothetical protein
MLVARTNQTYAESPLLMLHEAEQHTRQHNGNAPAISTHEKVQSSH